MNKNQLLLCMFNCQFHAERHKQKNGSLIEFLEINVKTMNTYCCLSHKSLNEVRFLFSQQQIHSGLFSLASYTPFSILSLQLALYVSISKKSKFYGYMWESIHLLFCTLCTRGHVPFALICQPTNTTD